MAATSATYLWGHWAGLAVAALEGTKVMRMRMMARRVRQ